MPRTLILTIACPFGADCPHELTVDVMPPQPGSGEYGAGGGIEDVYGCSEHVGKDGSGLSDTDYSTLWQLVAARLEEMSEP